jgi:hypothetical protein
LRKRSTLTDDRRLFMGCIFALFVGFAPRLAFLFLWLFTSMVNDAFDTFIWPLLGFIFLPFASIMYVLLYNPVTGGLSGWGWFWVILAVFLDLGSYSGSAYTNRDRVSGASSY